MTATQFAEKLGFTLLAGGSGSDREVETCYIGDLLSWVMGRAQEGSLWLTVMGNINAIAVAALADAACIVLTEDSPLDAEAKARADMQGIAVYSTSKNSYETAVDVYRLLLEK